jgi:RHS repeat-associated protein
VTALPQGQLAQPGSATQPPATDISPTANLARAANARSDFNIGYCGYRFNGEIGAYTVRFRHYDPTPGMCRWLERDPAGYQDGPSLYSYLGRNPMAGTDPYGLSYSGSGITVIAPDQIRPPLGAGELVARPGAGLRPSMVGADHPAAIRQRAEDERRRRCGPQFGSDAEFAADMRFNSDRLEGVREVAGGIRTGIEATASVLPGGGFATAVNEASKENFGEAALSAIPGAAAVKVLRVGSKTAKAARTTHKSWTSARAAYWKAFGPGGEAPKRNVLVRIRKTGQVREITQTKELHHRVAKRDGGTHDFDNLMEVWPDEHALIDPHRHTGYELLEVLSGP